MIGYILSAASVVWSSYAASSIFATILQLSHQRFLVAYPVGLLYVLFALPVIGPCDRGSTPSTDRLITMFRRYSAFSLFIFEVKKQ